MQLQHPTAAIDALTRASAIAADIGYEPLQSYADAQIETIRQTDSPKRQKLRFAFFRRGWGRFLLLALIALILVLIIKLVFFS